MKYRSGYKFNVIPSPKDERDYKLKDVDVETSPRKVVKAIAKPLPKKYKSLIIKDKYIFDQDEAGMCVACSLAQMWHIFTRLFNHISIKFSLQKCIPTEKYPMEKILVV